MVIAISNADLRKYRFFSPGVSHELMLRDAVVVVVRSPVEDEFLASV